MKAILKQSGIIFLEFAFAFGVMVFFSLNEKIGADLSDITNFSQLSDRISQLSFIPNAISVFIFLFMFLLFSAISAFSLLFIFKLAKKYRSFSMSVITFLCIDLLPALFLSQNIFIMFAMGAVTALKIAAIFMFVYSIKKSGILTDSKNSKSVKNISVQLKYRREVQNDSFEKCKKNL